MAIDNVTIEVGNVTRDPELRYLQSGTALATFGIAVNRRYQRDNEWVEDTSFFDVTCWRDLADNVAESFSKGDRVVVIGRLEQKTWETDNGEKRSKVDIVADDVAASTRFATVTIARNSKGNNNQAAPSAAPQAAPTAAAPIEPF